MHINFAHRESLADDLGLLLIAAAFLWSIVWRHR